MTIGIVTVLVLVTAVGSAYYLYRGTSAESRTSAGHAISPGTTTQEESSTSASQTAALHGPVPFDQIVSGGPPADGIPSIDSPTFVSPNQADFLSNSDLVIGVYHNGQAKAYPLPILVWHEIVNDVVGGTPVAITYCPLCFSTDAYVRVINGKNVTFGTSGKLYNNNLVMYDRYTRSLWSQIWGEAIYGDLTGYKLTRIPIDVLQWGEWRTLYPETLVLSTSTGYNRPYGTDPYAGYYTSSGILFPLSHKDDRLPVKTKILGLSINGSSRAYPLANLSSGTIEDSVGGQSVMLFIRVNNTARFFSPFLNGTRLHFFSYSNGSFEDTETNSTWNYDGVAVAGPLQGSILLRYSPETCFWFAWAAFYPNSTIYAGS